jgi:3-dehydroquinate dehydratase
MKKKDFIKWGEFAFGVLLEFDKRYNLTTDKDINKLIIKEAKNLNKKLNIPYQSRLEGFLVERISNIFYKRHFKKVYEISTF